MAKIERESINFKLPKPLADALRSKAAELETTATDLVIQGLHHILGDVPGVEASIEIRLYQLEEEFFHFKSGIGETASDTRLTNVEAKLEALSTQLARFEGALIQMQSSVNASRSRKSSYYPQQYSQTPPQLEPDFSRYLSITAIAIRSAILKVLFSRCFILIKCILLTIDLWAETLTISMFPDLTGKVSNLNPWMKKDSPCV